MTSARPAEAGSDAPVASRPSLHQRKAAAPNLLHRAINFCVAFRGRLGAQKQSEAERRVRFKRLRPLVTERDDATCHHGIGRACHRRIAADARSGAHPVMNNGATGVSPVIRPKDRPVRHLREPSRGQRRVSARRRAQRAGQSANAGFLLENAEWKLEGNSLIARVAASSTMIEMSFTADARRIASAAASGVWPADQVQVILVEQCAQQVLRRRRTPRHRTEAHAAGPNRTRSYNA